MARVLDSREARELRLPESLPKLAVYHDAEHEVLRRIEILDPLRAPGFPDDIQVVLLPFPTAERKGLEIVWCRMERRLESGCLECVLLNQPIGDFGLRTGDSIEVKALVSGDRIVATWTRNAPDRTPGSVSWSRAPSEKTMSKVALVLSSPARQHP